MPKYNRKLIGDTGQRLKKIRNQFELSQKEMATHAGITIKSYYKNENNETLPSFKTMHRLQKDFNVSMDWLIFNKGPMLFKEKQEEIKTATVEPTVEEISPELKDMLNHMEQDPRLRHELLAYYYTYKEKNTGSTTASSEHAARAPS